MSENKELYLVDNDRDGPSQDARFNGPQQICLDSDGNVLIADNGNKIIRKVDRNGMVSTIQKEGAGLYQFFFFVTFSSFHFEMKVFSDPKNRNPAPSRDCIRQKKWKHFHF